MKKSQQQSRQQGPRQRKPEHDPNGASQSSDFQYIASNQELNMRVIGNFDPDQLYYSGSADDARSALKNFENGLIPDEVDYETFSKLFRLSQLGIEFYTKHQLDVQARLDEEAAQTAELEKQLEALMELKEQHLDRKDKYNVTIFFEHGKGIDKEFHSSTIESIKKKLKSIKDKVNETRSESVKIGSFKCIYCAKCFRDRETLEKHISHRHLDVAGPLPPHGTFYPIQPDDGMSDESRQRLEKEKDIQQKQQLELLRSLQNRIAEQNLLPNEKLLAEIRQNLNQELDARLSNMFTRKQLEEQDNQQIEEADSDLESQQILAESIGQINSTLFEFQGQFQQISDTSSRLTQEQKEQSRLLQYIRGEQEEISKSILFTKQQNNTQMNRGNASDKQKEVLYQPSEVIQEVLTGSEPTADFDQQQQLLSIQSESVSQSKDFQKTLIERQNSQDGEVDPTDSNDIEIKPAASRINRRSSKQSTK